MKPILTIVGGPNGSGKTTFANELIHTRPQPYLGADAIAAELVAQHGGELNPILAGRIFHERIFAALETQRDFVVESTLSGVTLQRFFREAIRLGYEVSVVFYYLESPDLNVRRVQERVAKGGHDVPEVDIRRRFSRSLKNFWSMYRLLATDWFLIYNGIGGTIDVAEGETSNTIVFDQFRFERFLEMIGENDG